MNILLIIFGVIAGAAIGFLFSRNKSQLSEKDLLKQISDSEMAKATLSERSTQQKMQLETVITNLEEERKNILDLNWQIAQLKTTNENLAEKLESGKAEMEGLQKKFQTEFENIANKILEDKGTKFTEQNKTNMDIILNPLKEKILDFEKKVDNTYKAEAAERNSLKGEIKSLVELNKQISEEAINLTRALKGDTKKQGNWGEIILEKILERSGLEKGKEYKTQESFPTEEGRRIQPDVIILLPENKFIIVDAKVSLVAYEAMVNATDDDDRARQLLLHVSSVKGHIKNLSEKKYQVETKLDTPDFVLLFMPIESSFSTAIQADNELFSYAWDRKVVIVSPTTLLATLRTISSIWKQERQTKNALEIAEQGGKLYDKFVSFVEDITEVGKKMDSAKANYVDAMKKLSEGRGNLVGSAEKLKALGAKSSKNLPTALIERSDDFSLPL